MPMNFYDDIMLGREGREVQVEHVKNTIRNMGRAGIPVLGYHWMPGGVVRTGTETLRGGAEGTAFDLSEVDDGLTHGREYTEEEMWEYYEWFLREVLPVAEEAGVKLCIHPNDPPVENLGGIPQLFRNFENFKKAMELVPSDNHGLEFCLGCWSEMGEDLEEVIRHFGGEKIFYVHFRDVEGVVPKFHETFVDEGNYDTYDVMELLYDVGFDGMLIPDHVPHMLDDTDWDHRGRAYAVGYLKATLNAVARE
jgi:mannonate dehydratase